MYRNLVIYFFQKIIEFFNKNFQNFAIMQHFTQKKKKATHEYVKFILHNNHPKEILNARIGYQIMSYKP